MLLFSISLSIVEVSNSHCLAIDISFSLESTRLLLFDISKLFSFPTAQSLSIVDLPSAFAKTSFCSFSHSISFLYSLTTFAGSNANDASSKNCFFQFCSVLLVTSYCFDISASVFSDSSISRTIFVFCSALKFLIFLLLIAFLYFIFTSFRKQKYFFIV